MLRLHTVAKWMLGLGSSLAVYLFVVAYLRFQMGFDLPEVFLSGWEAAVYGGSPLMVLGGVLILRPWLLKNQTNKGAGGAIVFMAVLLLPGAYMVQHALFFNWFAARADGRIVAMHDARRGQVEPEVEYEAAGRTYTLRPHHECTSRSEPEYTVGDSLPVLYRPDLPEAAVVGTFSEMWGFAVFAAGVATFLLVMLIASRLDQPRNTVTFRSSFVLLQQTSDAGLDGE